ncbi:ABC transporter permease [Cupriavidus sp. AcVe19-1a]|uniref:ABC transporter permease n=1 Tax=Cupriavidus sp. AcVe19-1a TaxID=2821359 RepID=UPI001AE513E3|nr:ABC transporter permease [Cupriavidus sp. AcVe19-1a]MBP0632372.1 ABC transporter permease [Cupriavidus sp. AcVe19-1a]
MPDANGWRALPLLALFLIVFDYSLGGLLAKSVHGSAGLTLQYFKEAWTTKAYFRVLVDTLRVSLIATVVCVLLGYPLAYWMRGLPERRRAAVMTLVLMTFWVSILVRTYAWIVVLGNAGLVNRTLLATGLIREPLTLLYSEVGVTIGMANVLLPFLVLPLLTAMLRIDDRLLRAAASLGASRRQIFWRVFFPLSLPALGVSALLLFMLSLGFYITPAILGGGKVPLLGNLLDTLINETSEWSLAAAISTALLAFALAVFAVFLRLNRMTETKS